MNTCLRTFEMKKLTTLASLSAMLCFAAVHLAATPLQAVQFSYLDANYSQQIYAAPLLPNQEAGMAWTTSGNLLTRAGSTIVEYGPTQNTIVNLTNVHGVATTHPIAGLNGSGYGMTNGKDGYIYAATGSGLERFDPSNWAAPAQSLAGTVGGPGWGITTLTDGRIAYSDSINIYVYDPVLTTNALIYTSAPGVQVDDIEASTTGQIALSGHNNNTITVITYAGAPLITFNTPQAPDGLAFGDGVATNSIFSNNNDGSITKFDLNLGYSSLLTTTVIASNLPQTYPVGGAYGDLAAVGPDCAFYVTQYENGGSGGSTPGVGTHWDDGSTTSQASIVRIALVDSRGLEVCGFGTTSNPTPEPSTFVLCGLGAIGVWFASRRCRKNA